MKHNFPILWYEGMPLEPATFQKNFLYYEEKIATILQAFFPNHFGIVRIKFGNIMNGFLKLEELECVLSNSAYIKIKENELSIDLNLHKEELKNPNVFLFLCMPDNDYTNKINTSNPKYEIVDKSVTDLNGEAQTTVSLMKMNYKLVIGKAMPNETIGLPLAQIHFTGVNFEITNYIPPLLKISNHSILSDTIKQFLEKARDKLSYLVNKNDEKLETNMMIANLSSMIFNLDFLLKIDASAFAIFQALVQSMPAATSFSKNIPNIYAYEHLNCAPAMFDMLKFIDNSLDYIQKANNSAQFSANDGIFGIKLPESVKEKIVIGCVKKAQHSLDDLRTWMNNAIIATSDKLTSMQDQRVVGAKRVSIKGDEVLDIRENQDMLLFSVNLDGFYFSTGQMMCILNFDKEQAPDAIYLFQKNKV